MEKVIPDEFLEIAADMEFVAQILSGYEGDEQRDVIELVLEILPDFDFDLLGHYTKIRTERSLNWKGLIAEMQLPPRTQLN